VVISFSTVLWDGLEPNLCGLSPYPLAEIFQPVSQLPTGSQAAVGMQASLLGISRILSLNVFLPISVVTHLSSVRFTID
jgi:hypothetical protein